jgi:hypothetical protein
MEAAARLRASALVEQLAAEGPTFPEAAARELIALVPVWRGVPAPVQIDGLWRGSGAAAEGVAAGVGPVAAPGGDETRRWSLGAPPTWRCGLYKLQHRPGRLGIEMLFAETFEDQTGRALELRYDRRTGRPRALRLQVESAVELGRVRLAVTRMRPWKRPG